VEETGKEAGILGNEAADAAALKAGIPVFSAGQDQKTAAYGAGITKGVATVSLGTAAAFEILVDRNILLIDRGINMENLELPVCPHIENNQWVLEGCVSTAGAAIKWLNKTIVRSKGYAEMDRLCAASPPGSRGVRFFPLLEEEGSCRGITLGTGVEDIIRALYEGIAFEIKYQLESAVKAGALIHQLNVFGGAAKSEILCRIIADISGYPVRTFRNKELCLLGAAKLIASALGSDPEIFVRNSLAPDSYYEPNKKNEEQYQEIYFQYIQARGK
jgi:xylulokinase